MRRLVIIAAFLGLFLMHGTALAASGCQDTATSPVPSHEPHRATQRAMPAATPSMLAGMTPSAGDAITASVPEGGHGVLCLADQPRGKGVGAALAVVAGLVVVVVVRPWAGGRALRSSPRGPPRGGSALLVRLCVSRT